MNARPLATTITLLGGESTGKSDLAQALCRHLNDGLHIPTVLVVEQLRQWCETTGRAPRADEQAARAAEQTRHIETAARQQGVELVIADTTALVIAAYSELYFNDTSLLHAARAEQRGYGLTLLMGLDLPWVADGLFRDGPAVREATDAVLRRELQVAGVRYQTIYGKGPQRLQQALRAIGNHLGRPLLADDPALRLGRGRWVCDSCSDPDCEHRLFSKLLTTDHTKDPPP
ncbi:MAG: ATP-binding protein [Hydrogenophaga sp.]|nr:ATP-binding protein [Hydrogenophaga sp.]